MGQKNLSVTSRRRFLKTSGVLLACLVGGRKLLLTPAQAQAAAIPLQILSEDEADTLAGFSELVVPGASDAGIVQFIDKQLASDDPLLMLKYLGPPPPFIDFYKSGLQALAKAAAPVGWADLKSGKATALLNKITSDAVPKWEGPAASFLFFVLRADACDLVYGTQQGFEAIDMPYRAHIEPQQEW